MTRDPAQGGPAYDLPFVPDPGYLDLLFAHKKRVRHLYFGLGLPEFPDARPWQTSCADSLEMLCERLRLFPHAHKRLLLNGRIMDPRSCLEPQALRPLVRILEKFTDQGLLHGVVFADMYLLQALSDVAPGLCAALEAVPSVNCCLDTCDKALNWIERAEETHFRAPACWWRSAG